MIRVLFVCMANVCRSPMAEAIFAHLVRAEGFAGQEFETSCVQRWVRSWR